MAERPTAPAAPAPLLGFLADRDELRRRFVLSVILGPPRARRPGAPR